MYGKENCYIGSFIPTTTGGQNEKGLAHVKKLSWPCPNHVVDLPILTTSIWLVVRKNNYFNLFSLNNRENDKKKPQKVQS